MAQTLLSRQRRGHRYYQEFFTGTDVDRATCNSTWDMATARKRVQVYTVSNHHFVYARLRFFLFAKETFVTPAFPLSKRRSGEKVATLIARKKIPY